MLLILATYSNVGRLIANLYYIQHEGNDYNKELTNIQENGKLCTRISPIQYYRSRY